MSEKWFSIKKQYIEGEYINGLVRNNKQPSLVTQFIDFWWLTYITSHNYNAIEAHKKMSLRSFWLLKNDFPLNNSILKVIIARLWLETPTNHHQSLYLLIFGDWNIFPAIILMLLKLINKWIRGLFDFWKIIFHKPTTY